MSEKWQKTLFQNAMLFNFTINLGISYAYYLHLKIGKLNQKTFREFYYSNGYGDTMDK